MASLEDRIARLEAIEAIKQLKAQYWHACDQKDVEQVRECFVDGPAEIHYDGPVGRVEHRDGLYEVFKDVACRTNIVEIHHGAAPQIDVIDAQHAKGVWALVYHLMDTDENTRSVVGGYYHDEYRFADGAWKISRSRFKVVSVVSQKWRDDRLKVVLAGHQLPEQEQG